MTTQADASADTRRRTCGECSLRSSLLSSWMRRRRRVTRNDEGARHDGTNLQKLDGAGGDTGNDGGVVVA